MKAIELTPPQAVKVKIALRNAQRLPGEISVWAGYTKDFGFVVLAESVDHAFLIKARGGRIGPMIRRAPPRPQSAWGRVMRFISRFYRHR